MKNIKAISPSQRLKFEDLQYELLEDEYKPSKIIQFIRRFFKIDELSIDLSHNKYEIRLFWD